MKIKKTFYAEICCRVKTYNSNMFGLNCQWARSLKYFLFLYIHFYMFKGFLQPGACIYMYTFLRVWLQVFALKNNQAEQISSSKNVFCLEAECTVYALQVCKRYTTTKCNLLFVLALLVINYTTWALKENERTLVWMCLFLNSLCIFLFTLLSFKVVS